MQLSVGLGLAMSLRKHISLVFLLAFTLVGCKEKDSSVIVVRQREATAIKNCRVYIDVIYDDHHPTGRERRTAFLHTACDVSASSSNENWWGNGAEPPGFSLDVGDCMPLEDVYYCLEDVVAMESATFRPTYMKPEHPKGSLRRIH